MAAKNDTNTARGVKHRTLVVGLGKTGLSCIKLLVDEGVPVAVTDSRRDPPSLDELRERYPDMAVFLGGFDVDAFAVAEQIIVSPGVSLDEPAIAEARRRGVPVIGDIELFARRARAPIIAVTGSNGKSTVTKLVGELIDATGMTAAVGGNIGVPALDLLDSPNADYYVLELSSFQLEATATLSAAAAVILNLTPDHMDRYASVREYLAAKQRIFNGARVAVVNRDDPLLGCLLLPGCERRSFGLTPPRAEDFGVSLYGGERWLAKGERSLLRVADIPLPGEHNILNVMAALALCDAVGLPMAPMLNAVKRFHGLPHRMERVANHNGVCWYNDSKGTNVGATVAAVKGLREPLVIIAGGDGKGADFRPLAAALRGKARAALLMGKDARTLKAALDEVCPCEIVSSMQEAVARAHAHAKVGDSVLLSPACASLDMFSDFAERGRVFVAAIKESIK